MQRLVSNIRYTFLLAYPVIIGQLGMMMMGVVDSMMVGRIGAEPLAAASIANSLFILIFIIGIGISSAITPLTAISIGALKYEECGSIFRHGLLINSLTSLILAIIIIGSAGLIRFLDQPEKVAVLAEPYTVILGLSVFPSLVFMAYRNFIEGLSVMRPAMIITLLANIVNFIVNWLLIYGNWGFPELGLNGAGWATFSSRLFMMVMLIIYVNKTEFFKKFDMSLRKFKANISTFKKILNLGIPGGVQYFFEVGAFVFAAIMIGWFGTEQLAAHQIAINLASISFMSATGISAAGSIRVGNAVGKRSIKAIRDAGFTAIILGGSVMAGFGILFVLFNKLLPAIYISDEGVLSFASNLLFIAAMFQISDGVQAVGIGILRGLTDVKVPTIITFIAYWILAVPIGYFLGFVMNMQVYGVWVGFFVGLTASATLLTLRFNSRSRKKISI